VRKTARKTAVRRVAVKRAVRKRAVRRVAVARAVRKSPSAAGALVRATVEKMPAPAQKAMAMAGTTITKTVAVVRERAAGTARQAEVVVGTAREMVGKQVDQAKDLASKVGGAVESAVNSVIPGEPQR
jgi:hypothetical protein